MPSPDEECLCPSEARGAGSEAAFRSLGVSGGPSVRPQQSCGARVDRWTTAYRVSVFFASSHTMPLTCALALTLPFLSPSVSDNLGKEVITRLDTSIKTSQYFYTDSNGREVLQRK